MCVSGPPAGRSGLGSSSFWPTTILGRGREHPAEDLSPYAAFMDIEEGPRNELIVVEEEGKVIATLQLTFIPSLTHTGGERAQVEGVRVAALQTQHGKEIDAGVHAGEDGDPAARPGAEAGASEVGCALLGVGEHVVGGGHEWGS